MIYNLYQVLGRYYAQQLFHDTGVLVYEYLDDRAMTRQYLQCKLNAPEGIGCCRAVRHRV